MSMIDHLISRGLGLLQLASTGTAEVAGEAAHGPAHELLSLIGFILHFVPDGPVKSFIHDWEGMIYASLLGALIIFLARKAAKNPTMVPGKLQNIAEMVVDGLSNFICSILGPDGRKHVPFLGSLFVYILAMNLNGIVPFGKSPTASPNTTVALALMVFLYANFYGFKMNGPLGYIKHLAGSPQSAVEWAFVPIMFPIHVLGEIAKPVSLSLRLFGNVSGEDVLLFAFCSLGLTAVSFIPNMPVGIPFQTPFIILAFLTSFIQALVFTLLSTIYILLWLPHDHAEEGH